MEVVVGADCSAMAAISVEFSAAAGAGSASFSASLLLSASARTRAHWSRKAGSSERGQRERRKVGDVSVVSRRAVGLKKAESSARRCADLRKPEQRSS